MYLLFTKDNLFKEKMKTYIVEWKFEEFSGEFKIEAKSAKEAMQHMRTNYPTFTVDLFAVLSN